MTRISGKEAFLEILRAEGVPYIFGNPGTSEWPLMDALGQREDPRYVLSLHEGVALAMAIGFAQASGRVGITNFHAAPGLGNAMGMLYEAHAARAPVVVTAGQQDRRVQLEEPLLWGDLVQMARPCTKWAYEITRADDLPRAVRRAVKVAMTPPTGPVFLALPMDVLTESATFDPTPGRRPDLRTSAVRPLLIAAAEVLRTAQSPMVLVGDGASRAMAIPEVVHVAELLGARVYAEPQANSVAFPADHPLFAGVLPMLSPDVHRVLKSGDVLLVVGMNLFRPFLYAAEGPLPDGLKIVHVDADPWEVGKNYQVEVGIVADPKLAMGELASVLAAQLTPVEGTAAARRIELERGLRSQERKDLERRTTAANRGDAIVPDVLMRELADVLPGNAVVVNESVTSGRSLRNWLTLNDDKSFFQAKGGGLGYGMPAAIGVKMALPDRPVVALVGDGSALYAMQALWSAAHYRIAVTFVICNNRQYRILKDALLGFGSMSARQGRFVGMDLVEPEIDFPKLSECFGVPAEGIRRPAEVAGALGRALARRGPSLVDVALDSPVTPLF
jgi:benzoylformate decarboxylase